jgi:FixJ family two-component response regulator
MPNRLVSIIDDDPSVREGTVDLLNSAGFVAETFEDADAFLKSGRVDSASCVVADMRMPGMSGLELHDHLLRAGKNIPTILITAFPQEGDRARALKSGVCCYLPKPFSEKELLSHIRLAHSSRRGSGDSQISQQTTLAKFGGQITLFHEPWWLSAVTDGRFQEAVVKQGSDIVGRLPYIATRRGAFRIVRMPPFTHVLGPAVDAGTGKPQTRLMRRLSIIRSLIDQLPPNSYFRQCLDPSLDGGLAIADGLAFQDRGFTVAPQYTFQIDCRKSSENLWTAMHFKTRQHIRRAEEQYVVRSIDDPHDFIRFYLRNIQASGKVNRIDFKYFPTLFSECRSRKCGEILSAFASDGSPVAMVYLVWDHNVMYYLLSTRAPDKDDNGSVNFLLWSAMKQASQLGLVFDLDGVSTSGTARFLSGFGGQIKTRLNIQRSRMPYRALQSLKRLYSEDETQFFT